jgi:hypothetical protein
MGLQRREVRIAHLISAETFIAKSTIAVCRSVMSKLIAICRLPVGSSLECAVSHRAARPRHGLPPLRQRGGRSSPASHPTASDFMGSTTEAIFSVRPQVEHSKIRSMGRLWQILKAAFSGFLANDALSRGAAIAFYAATSLAPVLLIVVAIAGLALRAGCRPRGDQR